MDTTNDPVFPKGDQASPDYFTGTAWIKVLMDDSIISIGNVVFEPRARNNWHTHEGGQILIATAGVGYYQEKGEPIRLLHKGDVIKIMPGVEHWHGATPGSEFTHIAITTKTKNGAVNWLHKVTDAEYNSY